MARKRRSPIKINPANKGKFSAKAKAAGMSTQAYASKVLAAPEGRYDPATRRQANFAKNSTKFKHTRRKRRR
jgi:hypothetical protein